MNKLERVKIKRKQLQEKLGGTCYVCQKSKLRGMSFHHIIYRKGGKIHSDFKNWISYNEYVLPIIEKFPDQFALLCITCHRLISILQRIKDNDRFERVIDMSRRSRK